MTVFHYVNGTHVLEENAQISALDLGILRGYAVFDYVQLYKGKPFHLMDHLERLKWSAEKIELPLPLGLDDIYDLAHDLIKKNKPIDAGIRFILTGGESHDLLLPANKSNLMMLFHPYTPHPERYYTEGMKVITTNLLRTMSAVKTTNYMPAIFAMKKAKIAGFDDALYLNERQEVLEGTTCNTFFFKDGTLITSDSNEIVQGVTRKILLELAKPYFSIEYRSLSLSEVESCEEAFLCSSVKDVVPLVQINEMKIGSGVPGPLSAKLRSIYRSYIENYLMESHYANHN